MLLLRSRSSQYPLSILSSSLHASAPL
jgi:hypothetical protein